MNEPDYSVGLANLRKVLKTPARKCSAALIPKNTTEVHLATTSASHRHGRAAEAMIHRPTYSSWRAMKARCADPNNPRYGAAGIRVCDRWLHGEFGISGYELFAEDLGERPAGHWIERLGPTKGYSPENCRWVRARSHRTRRRQLDRKLVAIRKAIGGGGVEGAVSEGRVGMERHWSATTGSESEDA